jgi:general secretion pathway protein C
MKLLLTLEQFRHQLQKIPLSKLRLLFNVLLSVLLAWLLAKLSWQLLPVPETTDVITPPTVPFNSSSNRVDLAALVNFSLFGKAESIKASQVVPVAVVTEAPKTNLNVKLTGLVAISHDPKQGSAIIESRGSEATYAIDDKIDGTNAVLKQVLHDRVLLQQAGRYETLMLDGMEYTKIAEANIGLGRSDENNMEQSGNLSAPMLDPMEPLQSNEIFAEQRKELIAEPMKFFDYIRVSPQRREGQLVGYRLTPGKDPALFNQLGLQANDLAVEINGIRLDDMQQAMAVINELREAQEATIKIERDGETTDILVSLSQ